MRAAADGKDASVKHVAMENRLYPMRELLADLLLEVGQPAAALSEYESGIRQNPNRYRGFWGAAQAARSVGDRAKATDFLTKLVELAKKADSERPEISEAKTFLASK
jgi:predicted Zn-dependent protease